MPLLAPVPLSPAAGSDLAGAAWSLAADEVAVWRVDLDRPDAATVAELGSLLSADERLRAGRFIFERDRRRFVVGRGVLRRLLGRYLAKEPAAIAFAYGPHGKPALAGRAGERPLQFNVAHSDALALFAFTRAGEIGVDVERVRDLPDWEQIAALSLSAREKARLQALPEAARRHAFFAAWTRQEAILKAVGTGLGADPAVRDADDHGFTVQPLHPAPGYVGALATGGRLAPISGARDVELNLPEPLSPPRGRPAAPGQPAIKL